MLDLIECHHGNYDGSGYPAATNAANMPVGAGILTAAAAYIRLTSKHPYRNP
ncbi:MAG TPA: hypothetical protein DCL66_03930 [Gammaproteobacteria bacterium]|nr:hypothetical protein [Gammaproteobacteria bacterium]|tara:strand:- start:298 stop:453 length:156 start_codon:yes stop_codon:yes gene_type:complete